MIAHSLKSFSKLFLFPDRSPSYLLLFVTNRCEAACSHCFYWRERNRPMRELSLDELEQVARKCGPVLQVTLTGGSPELRDDLSDIALLFWKHCSPINITLCSNGNYPENLYEDVRRIYDRAPSCKLTVDISLDGLYEEHDRLRKLDGLFDNVQESYRLLSQLRSKHPSLRLGCGLCVSGLNKGTALKTARWAMDHLPIDNFTPILVRGEPSSPEALNTDSEVFLQIANEVEKNLRNDTFRGYASFSTLVNRKDIIQKRLIHRIYKTGRSPIRCSAARETAVIYPDGTVAGCEIRPEILGNLVESNMDIAQIWRGKKAREFREQIHREQCSCWHQCFLSPTIVKSPKLWFDYETHRRE